MSEELQAFWRDLLADSPILADIHDHYLRPYARCDIERWPEGEERRRALERREEE